ncbi:MAG: SDR family NAD(P)-dependent oxidoreductase [Anaerolineales bacterium]|nr:MAG: SDR family NAD(P)-dependent oxidoreductase [Anaerolineales bacterium]
MENTTMPVVFITGASSGIGHACAKALSSKGYRVYGTSRTPTGADWGFRLLQMDVGDEESVASAVRQILDETGCIDIVVNNAGMGYGGAVEDTSLAEAKDTIETNFFGVLRVCKAVLPAMRAQGAGRIINVSSIAGMIGCPFVSLYSASKYAMEGMTDALRMEVTPYGIKVILINPGDIATGFTKNRRLCQEAGYTSAYSDQFQRTLAIIEKNEIQGSSPDMVAKVLLKAVSSQSPKRRYIAGTLVERVAVMLRRWLPEGVFSWAVSKYYGM